MRFSTRTRYGLRFLIRLASLERDQLLQLGKAAEQEHISPGYLEQIARALKPLGILSAARGSRGGYRLAKPAAEINLEDVVSSLEGCLAPVGCLTESEKCEREESCGMIAFWRDLDAHTRVFLRQRTLADLSRQCAKDSAACGQSAFIDVHVEI